MMKKDIKDYLHLYLGCDCQVTTTDMTFMGSLHGIYWDRWTTDGTELSLQVITEHGARWTYKLDQVQLSLRKLDSMTEEECLHLTWLNMDSEKHLDADSRINKEEVDINVIQGDGGFMVDEDAALVAEVSCRCFIGQLCVRINGDIEVWSDAGEKLPIENQAENVRYLLSIGMDLFNLIPEGLAIDKNKKD
jgi:hypothetical protein